MLSDDREDRDSEQAAVDAEGRVVGVGANGTTATTRRLARRQKERE